MNALAQSIVTTSWDDGHPLDLRVACVLARHGLRGTFYVPLRAVSGRLLSTAELNELRAMRMEIGSHTVSHPDLTALAPGELDRELRNSRAALEDRLGAAVTSFCYPGGRFNSFVASRAACAGYRVCRTTIDFQTVSAFDARRMPVSLQLFPHRASTYYLHALRYGNWSGLLRWRRRLGGATDLDHLATTMAADMASEGGTFHLWGHSWELEQHGLWDQFERIVRCLALIRPATHLTNGELGNVRQG